MLLLLPKSYTKIARALKTDRDELLVIAGIREPDQFLDALDRFHRIADPYAREIDWNNEENIVSIEIELRRMISLQEIRAGRRRRGEYLDPVDVEDE